MNTPTTRISNHPIDADAWPGDIRVLRWNASETRAMSTMPATRTAAGDRA
ncbi:hypothetical protein [Paraburkholderia sp. Cy-641]|nr:hypothetical protein [Paraburkholderia sp. Cy-641]